MSKNIETLCLYIQLPSSLLSQDPCAQYRNASHCFWEYFKILLDLFYMYLCINHIKIYFLLLCRPQSYAECIHFDFKFLYLHIPGWNTEYHIFLRSLPIQMLFIKTILWNAKSWGWMFKITTNHTKCGKSILCRVPSILVIKCSYFSDWSACWLSANEICLGS